MFGISFNENGNVQARSFDYYDELLRFVATSGIKDEDFVSVTLFGHEINGMQSLMEAAVKVADGMKAMREAFIDIEGNEDECDEDEFDEEVYID